MSKIISVNHLSKSYITEKKRIDILQEINVEFETGKFYAIMGHSGSGKSTLINILGLIDNFDSGKYILFGKDITAMTDNELSKIRMKNIGFIFQEFYLNNTLKAWENVVVPMLINDEIPKKERKERSCKLLKMVGLEDRMEHYPKELSGGEQQRVAIARALANNPKMILADEPTGNLDEEHEEQIFNILKEISKSGKCVIVVTHSNDVKKYADIIYKISNGKIVRQDEI